MGERLLVYLLGDNEIVTTNYLANTPVARPMDRT
jgi:hypothetical protein